MKSLRMERFFQLVRPYNNKLYSIPTLPLSNKALAFTFLKKINYQHASRFIAHVDRGMWHTSVKQ